MKLSDLDEKRDFKVHWLLQSVATLGFDKNGKTRVASIAIPIVRFVANIESGKKFPGYLSKVNVYAPVASQHDRRPS